MAYFLGKYHGISYKRYSKDIIRHNSRLKSIAKTCRILNILEKRTRSFTKFTSAIGIMAYLYHLGESWSKNFGNGDLQGFEF
jgi:3-methyladenine DNA glycosylase Tag